VVVAAQPQVMDAEFCVRQVLLLIGCLCSDPRKFFAEGAKKSWINAGYCGVHGFLWKKMVGYTWIHNHKVSGSTWTHAHRVKENGYLTLKQVQKNVAATKQNCLHKQTYGTLKTEKLT
jgi:hypothetical protein